jgi:hypothetical protein
MFHTTKRSQCLDIHMGSVNTNLKLLLFHGVTLNLNKSDNLQHLFYVHIVWGCAKCDMVVLGLLE